MLLCNCVDFAVIETVLRLYYSGVRSGMATEELDMEVDRQVATNGANRIQARAVRMSVRPPARFSATYASDLATKVLWLRRFEPYVQQARIPTEKWVAKLLSLLEDEPFRVVMQQGLVTPNTAT